ncbi:D-2-hydroxyacid dehydrogenase [Methylobacterium sp. J-030]|uniref:D-2-hydroxyacid dehydrogenase n=1 Tax=Methylobacterium sp. J-030 TaxID=2836627 RepID=UPI001FBB76A6|nr:D-2-hydroxyacid dehydrogenase [Methylobacterium sp. J-030]MCJ2069472.1 D-2-hydroxyacid dehydrogenase [Methylobacterium sp. J-030]
MRDRLTVLFGHPAYQLGDVFRARCPDHACLEVRTLPEVEARIAEADVLVVSRFWRDAWVDRAERLRFIQAISAGTEVFDRARLRERGIRLASAQGGNAGAVAEHALAMILSLTRHLHTARDHQASRRWRGLIADPERREMELAGKTMVVVGLGGIGSRIAALAAAFGMRVVGVRRSAADAAPPFEAVFPPDRLAEALGRADVVVLACPLTPETEGLIDAAALAAMRPSAFLINVARGRVVDEAALIRALRDGALAGAGLDCFAQEPLPESSPLWGFENVVMTSHTAGESRACEARVVDILVDNLSRLASGRADLRNQIV